MYIEVTDTQEQEANLTTIVTKCPICHNGGTFDALLTVDLLIYAEGIAMHYTVGQRMCPNPQCRAHLFFCMSHDDDEPLITFPALRIDFQTKNIPERIRSCLEEAITCHAEGCFIASAIMVRRTLEELCEDKGIKADNLKKRLKGLKTVVVLPSDLLDALDELRILGNDATHIESKEYDKVGKGEVDIAIELTKEILKGVYQMGTLLAKLKKLKKPKKS